MGTMMGRAADNPRWAAHTSRTAKSPWRGTRLTRDETAAFSAGKSRFNLSITTKFMPPLPQPIIRQRPQIIVIYERVPAVISHTYRACTAVNNGGGGGGGWMPNDEHVSWQRGVWVPGCEQMDRQASRRMDGKKRVRTTSPEFLSNYPREHVRRRVLEGGRTPCRRPFGRRARTWRPRMGRRRLCKLTWLSGCLKGMYVWWWVWTRSRLR